MAAMTTTRSRLTSARKLASHHSRTETQPQHVSHVKQIHSEEPLEKSVREGEAPESWQQYQNEAPDGGRGELHPIEREFTQGRSRS
jgi:hypothetical protein